MPIDGPRSDAPRDVLTSTVLERLRSDLPADFVTLGWFMSRLGERSFGMVLLLLGVCGTLPVISPVAALLISVPAFQMMRGQQAPSIPRRLARYPIRSTALASVLRRVIPALRFLERFIRPRSSTPPEATGRAVGGIVLLLAVLLLNPVPLSNIPVGLTIVLLAFAYLEGDTLLLIIAAGLSVALLMAAAATLWGMVAAAIWMAK
jgi:hypothetical protein